MLKYAESHTGISKEDKCIINDSRKSLLFNNQQACIKQESRLFDVTMGAYSSVEVCELVGSFLLYQLLNKYNKRHWLIPRWWLRSFQKQKWSTSWENKEKFYQNFWEKWFKQGHSMLSKNHWLLRCHTQPSQ